ncbi:MAG: peptide deformylase [Sneathiella sp.]
MPALPLVIALDPVFRKVAEPVLVVDAEIKQLVADMFLTLYAEKGLGIGANMVGVLKRVIVIDLQENGNKSPIAMINPEIINVSEEHQTFSEASLSYPGIEADISRPKEITVRYLDENGQAQELGANGFLATVIQHERDYLDGRIFLDHLSRIKREGLMRKYKKLRRQILNA